MKALVRPLVLGLVAMGATVPAYAQSRVYTNADLGRPLAWAAPATPEQLASLTAHQFSLSPSYPPGPQVVVVGNPEDGPFGPFYAMPPMAPLSNDPYLFAPPFFYGGQFLQSRRHHAATSFAQPPVRSPQPMRGVVSRRGR